MKLFLINCSVFFIFVLFSGKCSGELNLPKMPHDAHEQVVNSFKAPRPPREFRQSYQNLWLNHQKKMGLHDVNAFPPHLRPVLSHKWQGIVEGNFDVKRDRAAEVEDIEVHALVYEQILVNKRNAGRFSVASNEDDEYLISYETEFPYSELQA